MPPRDFLRVSLEITSAEAEWLTRDSTAEHYGAVAELGSPLERVAQLRRRGLAAREATLVAELVELRQRAQLKFAAAHRMFFTRRSLEQATDELIASYKASFFPAGRQLVDLCCGLGGDALGLSRRGPLRLVDRDPALIHLAEHNLRATELVDDRRPSEASGETQEFMGGGGWSALSAEVEVEHVREAAAWHIDPDRRVAGRVTRAAAMTPSLDCLHELLRQNPHAAIKLAPATPTSDWPTDVAREWIGHQRECQQQIVWSGELARGRPPRQATLLSRDGQPTAITGSGAEPLPLADQLGEYLYEPASPVLAAGLVAALATSLGLASPSDDRAYVTSSQPVSHPLLSGFRIRDCLPFRPKTIIAYLRERACLVTEIKRRGVEFNLDELRRELNASRRASATDGCTLIVLARARKAIALIVERL